jgi:ATP-dependent Clp protease protease subunit
MIKILKYKGETTMKKDMFIDALLPEGIEELRKGGIIPLPEDINQWKDLNERTLFINDDIDETIVNYLAYYIRMFNIEDKDIKFDDRKPIKVFINSNGGLLNETMHCCDLIKLSKTPVYTICQSKAYSSGGLLLISGHKRYCYPSSTYLLHNGSTGMGGKTDTVFDTLEFQKKYEKKVKDLVISCTKFTPKEYDKNYRVELYLDSEDMLKYGVIDEVLEEII